MRIAIEIVVVIVLLLFVFTLQKWRKSIKYSSTKLDSVNKKRKKVMSSFLIDLFSIGLLGMAGIMIYFLFFDKK